MTRVQLLFVAALITVFSYGLLPAQPATPVAVAEAASPAAVEPALAEATPTPRPTFTPVPTATPTVKPTEGVTATATPTATAEAPALPEEAEVVEEAPLPTPTAIPTIVPGDPHPHPEEPRFLYIDQYTQRLYVYEYGELIREIPCSTGLPESDKYTPAAVGRVSDYWPTFTSFGTQCDNGWLLFKSSGNILIHSLPYLPDELGNKIYQDADALGVRPSSHGCIRISPADAEWLTAYNPRGALFEVTEPYLDKWLAFTPEPTVAPVEAEPAAVEGVPAAEPTATAAAPAQ
ncbi:MAG: L,D-transpeptidase [Anaerolineales bacterium]